MRRIVVVGAGYAGVAAARRLGRLAGADGGWRSRSSTPGSISSNGSACTSRRPDRSCDASPSVACCPEASGWSPRSCRDRCCRAHGGAGRPPSAALRRTGPGKRQPFLGTARSGRGAAVRRRDPGVGASTAQSTRFVADGATVTVVGAGVTGVELAAEVAERHPRLHVRLFACSGVVPPRAFLPTVILAHTGLLARIGPWLHSRPGLSRRAGYGNGYDDVDNLPAVIAERFAAPLYSTTTVARGFQRWILSICASDLLAVQDRLRRSLDRHSACPPSPLANHPSRTWPWPAASSRDRWAGSAHGSRLLGHVPRTTGRARA